LAAYIVSHFAAFPAQLAVFTLVSTVSIIITFAFFKKKPFHKTGVAVGGNDIIVGKSCVVTEKISNMRGTGRVTLDDVSWNAVSDTELEQDTIVVVKAVNGATLTVEAVSQLSGEAAHEKSLLKV